MLEDKIKATDWEATNEAIEEQVARESYLQWLRDNEMRKAVSMMQSDDRHSVSLTINGNPHFDIENNSAIAFLISLKNKKKKQIKLSQISHEIVMKILFYKFFSFSFKFSHCTYFTRTILSLSIFSHLFINSFFLFFSRPVIKFS